MAGDKNLLQIIPREVWLNIFQYGVLEDIIKVHNVSDELQKAFCIHTKHEFSRLRHKVHHGVKILQHRLSNQVWSEESLRLMIIKSIFFLKYITTELNVLHCMVKRYFSNDLALLILCPYLLPVIREFDNIRKKALNFELQNNQNLNQFCVKHLFIEYFDFLKKFDEQLEDQVSTVSSTPPLEIKVIDILSCCPSINSQLSVMKNSNDPLSHNICYYGFFHMLKPISQVPDVHNSTLSTKQKLIKLVSYLRECVQYENLRYLQNIIDEITFMEFRLNVFLIDENTRANLVVSLLEKYDLIRENLYEPFLLHNVDVSSDSGLHRLEHYCKEVTRNRSPTGLTVTVTIPNQLPENLPVALEYLRQEKTMAHEGVLKSAEEQTALKKFQDNVVHLAYTKRAIQLCISFLEGFNSPPSEAVIDVGYDHLGECHIKVNFIRPGNIVMEEDIIIID